MNHSKHRTEFPFWGQGIKPGEAVGLAARTPACARGQRWAHWHFVLIYYLHLDVHAYFITQARNRKARQEANMMGQGVKGRRAGAGRSRHHDLRAGEAPQPTSGGVPQSHRGDPSLRLAPDQSIWWAKRVCPPAWSSLGWMGVLAWPLVGHVHPVTSQLRPGGPGLALPSSFHLPALGWGSLLGCIGEGAGTPGLQGPCLVSLQSFACGGGACNDAVPPLAEPLSTCPETDTPEPHSASTCTQAQGSSPLAQEKNAMGPDFPLLHPSGQTRTGALRWGGGALEAGPGVGLPIPPGGTTSLPRK